MCNRLTYVCAKNNWSFTNGVHCLVMLYAYSSMYQCTMELYCMITFHSYRSDIAEIEPALELLNTHGADFDMVEVKIMYVFDIVN